ncbi:hypothetical protein TA3x_001241 [Tundrisphaera sp. TA3]|uniref:hypothetical protein n=1 Tax=Tundrisphaera sp. TA3 TaxID=3435775 RepID=UPI003EBD0F7F
MPGMMLLAVIAFSTIADENVPGISFGLVGSHAMPTWIMVASLCMMLAAGVVGLSAAVAWARRQWKRAVRLMFVMMFFFFLAWLGIQLGQVDPATKTTPSARLTRSFTHLSPDQA